jgi:hypothetical protein
MGLGMTAAGPRTSKDHPCPPGLLDQGARSSPRRRSRGVGCPASVKRQTAAWKGVRGGQFEDAGRRRSTPGNSSRGNVSDSRAEGVAGKG